jgi:hypothetical protein
MTPKRILTSVVAIVAGIAGLSWSDAPFAPGSGFVSRAEARFGRPLTPMSYAGVARRTTRRGYYGAAAGAVAGAAAVSAYAYSTSCCVQVVNSYGQVVTRCR